LPRRLIQRDGIWHYYRRVPARFATVDSRTFVMISLETRDLDRAEKMKAPVEREVEAYWIALLRGGSTDLRERYLGAIERARLEGFEYRPAADLAAGDVREILTRLDRLEELGVIRDRELAADDPDRPAGESAAAAIAGGAVMPELLLSGALDQFFALARETLRFKSKDQIRRWKAPRLKAVNNLIALVGDKPVTQTTRTDALALRAWWVERVVDEGYTPNSANKDIGHLAQILEGLNEKLELGMGAPFAKLRLQDDEERRRAAFSVEQLVAIGTDPRHLAELNDEARLIILCMIETGMRPSEICGLEADDILLAHNVPHVKVRPKPYRQLKTPYSERDIPLVGISLEAFRQAPEGFPRYRDRPSNLSALVNKALRVRGLLPTERHSLYSIRHTFQDRLNAANMPDRIQTELFGHKFDRPKYGDGPTLEHKLEWLLKIAITTDPGARGATAQMRLL